MLSLSESSDSKILYKNLIDVSVSSIRYNDNVKLRITRLCCLLFLFISHILERFNYFTRSISVYYTVWKHAIKLYKNYLWKLPRYNNSDRLIVFVIIWINYHRTMWWWGPFINEGHNTLEEKEKGKVWIPWDRQTDRQKILRQNVFIYIQKSQVKVYVYYYVLSTLDTRLRSCDGVVVFSRFTFVKAACAHRHDPVVNCWTVRFTFIYTGKIKNLEVYSYYIPAGSRLIFFCYV